MEVQATCVVLEPSAVTGARTPIVNVPPVPLCAGIATDTTRLKCSVPLTVEPPPLGTAKVSVIVAPSTSRPVTVIVVASQSAWEEKANESIRATAIEAPPVTPSRLAPVSVCVPAVLAPVAMIASASARPLMAAASAVHTSATEGVPSAVHDASSPATFTAKSSLATGVLGVRFTTCVKALPRRPIFTEPGRGFCAKRAEAILYAGSRVLNPSETMPARLEYDRTRAA